MTHQLVAEADNAGVAPGAYMVLGYEENRLVNRKTPLAEGSATQTLNYRLDQAGK